MTSAELNFLLAQGESLHVEFELWPVHPDDLAAAITAFANTDGGKVFIGVADNGQVVGVTEDHRDRIARTIDNVAFQNVQPPVTVETVMNDQGKVVGLVQISRGSQRPYRTNRGVYYVRTASGRRQASREELLRLFQASENLYYDETPIVTTAIDDIEAQAQRDLYEMAR